MKTHGPDMSLLPCVEVNPAAAARACVIFMHGLGADGHDFGGVVEELRLPPDLGARFVFPHAPLRPITVNGGWMMRGWYDIADFHAYNAEDEAGMRSSRASLEALIAAQMARGIAAERIALAGFSQGGAIALYTGLRYHLRLAGVLALSAYLPLADKLVAEMHEANRAAPIFLAHGAADNVISLHYAERTAERLRQTGYDVEWHVYPMGHNVSMEELKGIAAFLERILQ